MSTNPHLKATYYLEGCSNILVGELFWPWRFFLASSCSMAKHHIKNAESEPTMLRMAIMSCFVPFLLPCNHQLLPLGAEIFCLFTAWRLIFVDFSWSLNIALLVEMALKKNICCLCILKRFSKNKTNNPPPKINKKMKKGSPKSCWHTTQNTEKCKMLTLELSKLKGVHLPLTPGAELCV